MFNVSLCVTLNSHHPLTLHLSVETLFWFLIQFDCACPSWVQPYVWYTGPDSEQKSV